MAVSRSPRLSRYPDPLWKRIFNAAHGAVHESVWANLLVTRSDLEHAALRGAMLATDRGVASSEAHATALILRNIVEDAFPNSVKDANFDELEEKIRADWERPSRLESEERLKHLTRSIVSNHARLELRKTLARVSLSEIEAKGEDVPAPVSRLESGDARREREARLDDLTRKTFSALFPKPGDERTKKVFMDYWGFGEDATRKSFEELASAHGGSVEEARRTVLQAQRRIRFALGRWRARGQHADLLKQFSILQRDAARRED